MSKLWSKKLAAFAVAIVAPLTLGGCLILPGEFTSEMIVRRSGEFSFSYKGQIQLIGLAALMDKEMFGGASSTAFTPYCWDDETDQTKEVSDDYIPVQAPDKVAVHAVMRANGEKWRSSAAAMQDDSTIEEAAKAVEEAVDASDDAITSTGGRECTAKETAEQKKQWDDDQAASKIREEEQKKMMAAMFGGIDPKDPATIIRFTKELERMTAWHKVEHLGNGLFLIDYSTSGRLADNFAFPVIPHYAIGEPMIHVTRWDNGRVRVEAPAFKTDPEMSMMTMLGAGSMMGLGNASSKKPISPVAIKGVFTLKTDAGILANNTDEGPESISGMEVLRWDVGPATYGAPVALLKLVQ